MVFTPRSTSYSTSFTPFSVRTTLVRFTEGTKPE